MNDYDPRFTNVDPGGGMRAFFIVILFFLAFILFFSTSMAGVNLTPTTPGAQAAAPAPAAPAQSAPAASQPQVITIQESPSTTSQAGGSVPVTGSCTNPYTVQSGDTLSQIAVNCNTTLAAIRQANPQITDANMILPGQQVNIPNAAAPQPTVVIPETGKDNGTPFVPQPTATAPVPVTGVIPTINTGTGLQVRGINFPPNTQVNVAIGPQSQGYTIVANGVTDAGGSLTTNITVPTAPNAQTPWVVVVATTSQPPIQAMSQPFFINP